MSQVVDEGDGTFRVRRQRRSAIVLAIVLLCLGGAFYYASSYFRGSTPEAAPCTTAPTNGTTGLRPADVSLNVYNSTSRRGLAAAVAKEARDRGFTVKAVANDPKHADVKQVAQIRFGPEGAASAKIVHVQVPKAVLVNDKRKGDTVDLVLGKAWRSFAAAPAVSTPASTLPPCPTVTVTQ